MSDAAAPARNAAEDDAIARRPLRKQAAACKYYMTKKGCRQGDACSFVHGRGGDPLKVPASLLEAVNALRPRCKFFGTKLGCRKGKRCPLLHDKDYDSFRRLPNVTRHIGSDGKQFLSLRPPLTMALGQYWEQKYSCKAPFHMGKTFEVGDQRVVVFHLDGMPAIDATACAAAKAQRGVTDVNKNWKGESSAPLPPYGFHGTSIASAMQIIAETRIRPSTDGKVGAGTYTMACPDPTDIEGLKAGWVKTGAYNMGCGLIVQVGGILITRMSKWEVPVPAGATSWDHGKQYSHSSESCCLSACVFAEDGLLEFLDAYLMNSGYTRDLHKALLEVAQRK